MSSIDQPNTPENREKARSRLRNLTRGVVVAAAGATVVIGVVVSRDHPGSAHLGQRRHEGTSSRLRRSPTTNGGSSATSGSSSSGTTGSTGTTGTTGNTGTSSSAPSVSQSSPTVTSGGSSR